VPREEARAFSRWANSRQLADWLTGAARAAQRVRPVRRMGFGGLDGTRRLVLSAVKRQKTKQHDLRNRLLLQPDSYFFWIPHQVRDDANHEEGAGKKNRSW